MTSLDDVTLAAQAYGSELVAAQKAADDTLLSAANARIAELEAELSPPTPVSKCLIGASLSGNASWFGHTPQVVRSYLSPGQKPAKWGDVKLLAGLKPGQGVVFSTKVHDPTWLTAFLKSRPAGLGPVRVVCGYHEPEDNVEAGTLTLAQYRQWCVEDAAAIRAADCISIQILMAYSITHRDWKSYVVPEATELWWDAYHPGAGKVPTAYQTPKDFLAKVQAASATAGKPWGLGEVGSLAVATDTSQAGLAKWYADLRAYLLTTDAAGACQWDSVKYMLTQATADAWFAGL